MNALKFLLLSCFIWIAAPTQLHAQEYVTTSPNAGEGIWSLLRRSGVDPTPTSVNEFKVLNQDVLQGEVSLHTDLNYRIPTSGKADKNYPIFGPEHASVSIKSDRLEGHVYYIVGGHGGPDPGTLGTYGGKRIAEDEIAYDTSLRLARELLTEGATVHIIVQDPDDGIRDDTYLPADRDEKYLGGKTIVLNQASRLRTRARIINSLYDSHRSTALSQQVISLHVDSYGYKVEPQVDVHFIVASESGRELGEDIRSAMEKSYAEHQPNRGYHGEIKSRDLMILRETKPPAILIELGNIRHPGDQQRLVKPENRQTLAEWIKDGLLERAANVRT